MKNYVVIDNHTELLQCVIIIHPILTLILHTFGSKSIEEKQMLLLCCGRLHVQTATSLNFICF